MKSPGFLTHNAELQAWLAAVTQGIDSPVAGSLVIYANAKAELIVHELNFPVDAIDALIRTLTEAKARFLAGTLSSAGFELEGAVH